jgi:hypothetical protein
MSATILGTQAATLQPIRFGWSAERGHQTTKEWQGGESQVRALIPQIVFDGGSWEVDRMPGDMWKITATYSKPQDDGAGPGDAGGQEIAVTWELLPKDAQKQLLGSFHSLVAGLSAADIDQIKAEVDNTTKTVANTTLTGNALKVFKLMRAGVDTVEIEQPVLNLTWIVPNNVNLSYSYANIGRIYTTSSLISTENIPGYISTSMVAWTSSFSNPSYGTNRVSLVFGWKKRAPTQRLAGLSRREISQTWEFGLWATDIYGGTV